ncbi:ABC transporter [Microbacterium faecale]|uniref:ABC transporter n=2 Tax=Microbacterium faecale TaxID=1804630 RepID=A0A916YHP0_9MICO|nr:ABC transporter [Microbacterium faecale]
MSFYASRMTDDNHIEAEGLTKVFTARKRRVTAVADVTFTVRPGELVAFLGPNGAGKSTSLRMLTTLLPPTAGAARVVGHDVRREPAGVRARVGYVGQHTSGAFSQRVRDELMSQGAFYGMGKRERVRRADELIESLDLTGFATRTVQDLSGGQKRRLDIALGLMHAPPLIFLDEPSTGLDPQSRANLWEHIVELRRRHGTTVFLTTHYLDEADRYAERVMIMDRGRIIADDAPAALKETLAGGTVTLGFARDEEATRARSVVSALAGSDAHQTDASLTLTAPHVDRLLPRLVRDAEAAGSPVASATGVPPTLDDVFLSLTGRTLRDADDRGTGTDTTDATTEAVAPDTTGVR